MVLLSIYLFNALTQRMCQTKVAEIYSRKLLKLLQMRFLDGQAVGKSPTTVYGRDCKMGQP